MSSMFLEWSSDWDSRQLIIWNVVVIGIPLTIWLTFKILKIIEKNKAKKQ